MSDNEFSTKGELKSAEEFSLEASQFKTPKKLTVKSLRVKSFDPMPGLTNSDDPTLKFISKIQDQLNHIEVTVNEYFENADSIDDQVFTSLKMLEFEKNRLKSEIGNRNQVVIPEDFDAASVWQTVSVMGSALN